MKLKLFVVGVMVMGVMAGSLSAQTVTVLHIFPFTKDNGTGLVSTNSDGTSVVAPLLVSGNMLYGMASAGGLNGNGTIFSMALNGSNFMVLHTFAAVSGSPSTNADGAAPQGGLILSSNTLYGTAQYGGRGGWGTIFSMDTNGSNFTVLRAFTNQPDGAWPEANLLLAGGTLYGTTDAGGTGLGVGYGTIFSMNINGSNFVVLHAFTVSPDGQNPVAGLALSGGTLYGTTQTGGTNGFGTVFSFGTNSGNYLRLRSFTNSPDGHNPEAGLVVLGNRLYGTTASGGTNNNGTVFSMGTNGANYTTLRVFTNNPDGSSPRGSWALSGGTLYGITASGGTNGLGSIYSINTNGGNYTVLHSYAIIPDGFSPLGGLTLANNTLYGSSSQGGGGIGTILGLSLPFTPIVISNLVLNVDGSVTINFSGASNTTYLVQAATNLTPTVNWQPISTNTSGTDGTWQTKDTNTSHFPVRFYRASTP